MISSPLAYLISFRTYGSWLHGAPQGSTDRAHNAYNGPKLPPNPRRAAWERQQMVESVCRFDERERRIVLEAFLDACAYRGWVLHAAHVLPSHVHVVVSSDVAPEHVMGVLKRRASRCLTEQTCGIGRRRYWTRHGSTRYLWHGHDVEAAARYVIEKQGHPEAVFDGGHRLVDHVTPRSCAIDRFVP